MKKPSGIALDGAGNSYVSDSQNNEIDLCPSASLGATVANMPDFSASLGSPVTS